MWSSPVSLLLVVRDVGLRKGEKATGEGEEGEMEGEVLLSYVCMSCPAWPARPALRQGEVPSLYRSTQVASVCFDVFLLCLFGLICGREGGRSPDKSGWLEYNLVRGLGDWLAGDGLRRGGGGSFYNWEGRGRW